MPATHTFYLPFVDFGPGDLPTPRGEGLQPLMDRIEFTAEGAWTLHHLVDCGDGNPISAAEAVARKTAAQQGCEDLAFSTISALKITGEGLDEFVTARTAVDISSLLSLALGQTVNWTLGTFQHQGQPATLQRPAVRAPLAVGKKPPLKNNGTGLLPNYLQAGHANLVKDREWWQLSLDWWVQMHESSNVHIVGLLASILLERAGEFYLAGIKWRDQIDTGVDAFLNKRNTALLAGELDDFFKARLTGKWESHRSSEIVSTIKRMNNSLSYGAKVTKACEELGLAVPSADWLRGRNSLAHQGELHEAIQNLGQYHHGVRQAATDLRFKLLAKPAV